MTIERLEALRAWMVDQKSKAEQSLKQMGLPEWKEHIQFLEDSIEALVQAESAVQKSCDVCQGMGCPVCVPHPEEAEAFLFNCIRPGRQMVFASIAPEGLEGYPFSEWDTVDRQRLIAVGPRVSMFKKGS